MNTVLTNEEKARIFAMYFGAPIFIGIHEDTGKPTPAFVDPQLLEEIVKGDWLGNEIIPTELLLLKSLEDITDEDANEVSKLYNLQPDLGYEYSVHEGKSILCEIYGWGTMPVPAAVLFNKIKCRFAIQIHQLLIQKGYSVPIYPYNQTPIELGIAIDIKTLKQ